MKNLLYILSISLAITGCDISDFGDTNQNVNGPTEGNTASLLSGAMTNFASWGLYSRSTYPTLYVQYFMKPIAPTPMLYDERGWDWQSYYVQLLSNLSEVIETVSAPDAASDPAILANGALENQKAVAMIFKAVVFKRVTDLFGDVPYSDALNIETFTPRYDQQEDIYAGMITNVRAARDMINVASDGPTGDAIYGGDMDMWIKFANSFLMQLSIQLSEVSSSKVNPQAEFVSALAHPGGVIEMLEEEAWHIFDVENGFYNPWNQVDSTFYGVSMELVSSLKGRGENKVTSNTTFDNRLLVVMADTSESGLPYGFQDYDSTSSDIASILFASGTPMPLLTAAYTWLNRAEAAERGWSSENVTELLSNGIKASFVSFEALYNQEDTLSLGDGASYALARVEDAAEVGNRQVIAEEKWIALYPIGFDAWSEWRRTEIPILKPAADAMNNGEIPRRGNYPGEEASLNNSNYRSAVSRLSPPTDNNTSRIWWNQ